MKNLLLILFVAAFSIGCKESLTDEQKTELLSTKLVSIGDSRVDLFKMSDCLGDCHRERGKIMNQSLEGDVLSLQLGHWMNCERSEDDHLVTYEYNNSVLNITFKAKPIDVFINDDGDTTYDYGMQAMCDCYFVLDLKFSGISEIPDSILIEGEPVDNYSFLLIGLEENLGTIDKGSLEVLNRNGEVKKSLKYVSDVRISYKVEAFEEFINWHLLSASSSDTLLTFKYARYGVPRVLCYDSRCDTLVETIALDGDTVYKYHGYDKDIHGSEVFRYFSLDYGILATFGQAPPEYYRTEKNKVLLEKLRKHGI